MKMNKLLLGSAILSIILIWFFSSCRSIPKNAVAVKPFDSKKYLGDWYEIARLDFRFEKIFNNTTANYSLNPDGSIKVINRGYNYKTKEWKQAIGKAKFVADTTEAKLKVSFFGPFYAGYNVLAIDAEYKYALIAGKNLNYLWLLSRERTMPESVKQNYLQKAKDLGYNISELIWVEQNKQ